MILGDQTALIQTVPSDQLIKKGASAYFDCAYEHADVTEWYFKDFGPLENSNRLTALTTDCVCFYTINIFRITIHSNSSLHIKDVQESDVGLYSCIGIRGESTEVPQSYAAELRLAC